MSANRLAKETSPYLLQHAHNPVDWYPWGEEAFAAARAQDKAIFLSVGYSTCYWCHVMERQSFENDAIAAEMNRRFINIKVDREERPDVDQLYMNAVHALVGQGGWPMSVFLTPDLKPFYGGTYFPPVDGHGRVGFPRLLAAIDDAWKNRRDQVLQSAGQVVEAITKMAEPSRSKKAVRIDRDLIDDLLERSTSDYDPAAGGFGSAPKFPRETLLELILAAQRDFPNSRRMSQLLHTLDAMARGGIRDHLGGGFHRYSTDDQWLVPHFEIMLYDNAMLAWVYAEAFSQTREEKYARTARGIFDFILREMTDAGGGFYTAIDAEVDAREGMPYLWTAEQITEILGADAALFNRIYGVETGPNFADPHHGGGIPDSNILYLPREIDDATYNRLAPMREALYAKRRERKQPLLDTKILTSWNALMIRALAHGGKVLSENRYLAAAGKAADFLMSKHRQAEGALYRVSRDGVAKGDAFLDDYAYLTDALLSLDRREEAAGIAARMKTEFLDSAGGGFYFTAAGASDMIVRQKIGSDSPLPSGNAVAARVMLHLGEADITRAAIAVFAASLQRHGEGMSAMVQTAIEYVSRAGELSVAGAETLEAEKQIVALSAEWVRPDQLDVHVSIAAGFHINATPAAQGLVATRLAILGEAAKSVSKIEYPPAKLKRFEFAHEAIPIYDGEIVIEVRLKEPLAAAGLELAFHYQACDEQSCQAPASRKFSVKI